MGNGIGAEPVGRGIGAVPVPSGGNETVELAKGGIKPVALIDGVGAAVTVIVIVVVSL